MSRLGRGWSGAPCTRRATTQLGEARSRARPSGSPQDSRCSRRRREREAPADARPSAEPRELRVAPLGSGRRGSELSPTIRDLPAKNGAAPSSGPAIYPQSAPRIAAASLGWSPPSARATFPIPARPGRSGVRSIGGGLDACSPSAPGAVCAKSADASPQQFGSAGLSAKADGAAARASTPAAASAFTALTRPPPLRRGYIASGARIQTGREGRRKAHEA